MAETTIAEIKQSAEQKMGKSLDALKNDLAKVRTGRAHAGILDHVMVDYYGNPTPVPQVANVSLVDSRTLGVQLHRGLALSKTRRATLALEQDAVGARRVQVGQGHLAAELGPQRADHRRKLDLVLTIASLLDRLTAGDARLQHLRVVERSPDRGPIGRDRLHALHP